MTKPNREILGICAGKKSGALPSSGFPYNAEENHAEIDLITAHYVTRMQRRFISIG